MSVPRLITCVLPKGKAVPALKMLRAERGLLASNVHNASGLARINSGIRRSVVERTEKEILTVVVPEADAQATFEFLYHEAGIAEAHGGFMFQTRLQRTTEFTLPEDLPEED